METSPFGFSSDPTGARIENHLFSSLQGKTPCSQVILDAFRNRHRNASRITCFRLLPGKTSCSQVLLDACPQASPKLTNSVSNQLIFIIEPSASIGEDLYREAWSWALDLTGGGRMRRVWGSGFAGGRGVVGGVRVVIVVVAGATTAAGATVDQKLSMSGNNPPLKRSQLE